MLKLFDTNNPDVIYLFKVNNGKTRTICEICSKLILKTAERRHWCLRRSSVFIADFNQISHIISIVDFERVNVHWEQKDTTNTLCNCNSQRQTCKSLNKCP